MSTLDPLRPIVLELRHLRLVLAIEEEGGVTRAGERLHLTQSALSHQLKEIEDRLGVPLFLRVRRRLILTEAGERVVAVARRLLAEVVELEDELGARAAGRRGALRLTTECYTCYDWLPPLLGRFEALFPAVEVRIVVAATCRPLAALAEGEVDLALVTAPLVTAPLVTAPVDERRFAAHPLFEDELVLLAAAGHRLARRPFVRPADLAAERLLLYSAPAESKFCRGFLDPAGVTPREVLAVQLTEAIVSMVKAGRGVSPLARWAVERPLAGGEVVGLRLGPRGLRRTWLAVTRRDPREPAYLAAFVDLLAGERAQPARSASGGTR